MVFEKLLDYYLDYLDKLSFSNPRQIDLFSWWNRITFRKCVQLCAPFIMSEKTHAISMLSVLTWNMLKQWLTTVQTAYTMIISRLKCFAQGWPSYREKEDNHPSPICTCWISALSDKPISHLGIFTNEVMIWIRCAWLGWHAKCAALGVQ